MAKYVFGVDIGGTTVKIGLFTAEGTMVDKWEITTRTDEGGKYILGDIAASIEDKLAEKQIDKSEVKGIGMGVPGPVKADGTVLRCVNLGWGIFNAADELSKIIGLPVKVGNDANMAALGEMWQGGGKGFSNIVMVTLGTGVGGGIILGGKMLSGVNGAGGEIGHIQVNDDETEVCGCGRKGCLEQYTSATGIVRMANTLLNTTDRPSALRNVQYVSAKEVFDAAKQGDELAAEIVDRHGKCLAKHWHRSHVWLIQRFLLLVAVYPRQVRSSQIQQRNISRSMHSTHARTRSSHLQHLEMMPVCMVEPVRL